MNLEQGLVSESFSSSRIYLNSASSSLIPKQTISAMSEFTSHYNNMGPDSLDFAALLAEKTVSLRNTIARLVGCRQEEVVLTQSVTDGINLVANGISLGKDSNIVIRGTTHEHHANYFPWLRLARKTKLQSIPHDQNGFFHISDLEKLLNEDTKLVALSHGLYNTGAILPADEIGKVLRERGVPYFLDAAQTVGCIGDYDFGSAKCDFLTFNGYKWLCGPMGIGVFICKKESADLLEPMQVAGESAMLYGGDKLAYKDIPDRFQASYRNYAAIAGLDTSISLLLRIGLQNIRRRLVGLSGMLREELSRIPSVTLYGPEDAQKRTSIVSFAVRGRNAKEIVEGMERRGIVLALREISDVKIVRASPHIFNTESDIQKTVDAIRQL